MLKKFSKYLNLLYDKGRDIQNGKQGKYLKILIIGAGKFGSKRLKVASNLGFKTYVVEICPDRRKELKNEYNDSSKMRVFEKIEDLPSKDFDLTILSTPNYLHLDHILEVDKQLNTLILCEKPVVTSKDQLKKLDSIHLKNELLMGENFLYFPVVEYLRHEVDYQEVRELKVSIGHNSQQLLNSWNLDKQKSGGGTLIDNGIHVLNFLYSIFENLEISDASFNLCEQGVEETANIHLNSGNGCRVTFNSSWKKKDGYANFQIFFKNGKRIEAEITSDQIKTFNKDGSENTINLKSSYSLENEIKEITNIPKEMRQSILMRNIKSMNLVFDIYNFIKNGGK